MNDCKISNFAIILLVFLFGCANIQHGKTSKDSSPKDGDLPSNTEIIHAPTNQSISRSNLMKIISEDPVIFVGEQHGHDRIQSIQLLIIKGLHGRFTGDISVGFELFREPRQELLDRFISGSIGYDKFKEELDWKARQLELLDSYRPILAYCRRNKISVVALNPSKKQERYVRKHPQKLNSSENEPGLPKFGPPDPRQRNVLKTQFQRHVPTDGSFKSFFAVHRLWEETMAQRIVGHQNNRSRNHRMIVLAGRFHVQFGFGVQAKLMRRKPLPYSVIIPTKKSRSPYQDSTIDESMIDVDFIWQFSN